MDKVEKEQSAYEDGAQYGRDAAYEIDSYLGMKGYNTLQKQWFWRGFINVVEDMDG